MAIDWTINVGNIVTALCLALAGLRFIFAVREDINTIKRADCESAKQLEEFQKELKEISSAVVLVARQDEQIKGLQHRVFMIENASSHCPVGPRP